MSTNIHKEEKKTSNRMTESKETAKATTNHQETFCDLDKEFTQEDKRLFDHIKLTEEQMKLMSTDTEAFWKSVAESTRSDLQDWLGDNQDLHRLKELMEEENRDLMKENLKLDKIVKEAGDICGQFLEISK